LANRVRFASSFWLDWTEGQLFQRRQPEILQYFENRFGPNRKYFAIDGGEFPKRGLGVFEDASGTVIATIGMGLCPMPNVELYVEASKSARRVELATRVDASPDDPIVEAVAKSISSIARIPWTHWTWFGDRHTCEWNIGTGQKKVRMALDSVSATQPLAVIHDDPVFLLWLVPQDSI
jgi:hypothetical protein